MVIVKECVKQRMTHVLPDFWSEYRRRRLHTSVNLTQFAFSRIYVINEVLLNHLDEVAINLGQRILNVGIFLLEEFVFANIVPIFEVVDVLTFSVIGL